VPAAGADFQQSRRSTTGASPRSEETGMTAEPVETVTRRTSVAVVACDPVTGAGVASQLRFRPELEVLGAGARGGAVPDVVVVVTDEVDDERVRQVRTATRAGARVVLVASNLSGPSLLDAVDAGATAVLRRVDATVEQLVSAVRGAARGDGMMPPDLLGKLMQQVTVARPDDAPGSARTFGGLTQRELRVLRLLADGYTTSEIAAELAYSERTIKNAIQALTARLQLRNRSHAVAYAVRQGLI
jgi:DNA-binding NarL/FixJ family response regulator